MTVETVYYANKYPVLFSNGRINYEIYIDRQRHNFLIPNQADKMMVDLEATVSIRDTHRVALPFLRYIIEKYGADSPQAKYAALKFFPNATDALQVPQLTAQQEEDTCAICPVFIAAYREALNHSPVLKIEVNMAEMMLRYADNHTQNPAVKQAIGKTLETLAMRNPPQPSGDQLRAKYDASWKVGPLKDSAWLGDSRKNAYGANVDRYYYPYLGRLHELYDNEVKTKPLSRLYGQFGLAFYNVGRYDLAESLFEQVISWRDAKGQTPDPEVHVFALYLLATIKQRNRDVPAALRLAKEALDYMHQHPQSDYGLFQFIKVIGVGRSCKGNGLKVDVPAFLEQLRENPEMKFTPPLP